MYSDLEKMKIFDTESYKSLIFLFMRSVFLKVP